MGGWNKSHGMTNTRLYRCWIDMRRRCYSTNRKEYKRWGNKGIEVCPEWKSNFEAFMTWALSNGYNDKLTLDRIDNNGNYEPSNCRWATPCQQTNNRVFGADIRAELNGKNMVEYAKEQGVVYSTLWKYIRKDGMAPSDAVAKCRLVAKDINVTPNCGL